VAGLWEAQLGPTYELLVFVNRSEVNDLELCS
jgi:hypothetical protein